MDLWTLHIHTHGYVHLSTGTYMCIQTVHAHTYYHYGEEALIQYDWCPSKKTGGHSHTQWEEHVEMQEWGTICLWAKGRVLRRKQPCWYFGLGLSASGTGGNQVISFSPPSLQDLVMVALWRWNYACDFRLNKKIINESANKCWLTESQKSVDIRLDSWHYKTEPRVLLAAFSFMTFTTLSRYFNATEH